MSRVIDHSGCKFSLFESLSFTSATSDNPQRTIVGGWHALCSYSFRGFTASH